MRLFLYAVFDSASGVYDRPWCALSDGAALRSFTDIACDADHAIGKHPEHYSLFRLGDFDDNTAEISPEDAKCIGKAHELVAASRRVSGSELSSAVAEQVAELEVVGNA